MRKNILFSLIFALFIATNALYLFYVKDIQRQIETSNKIAMNKINQTLAENTLLKTNITPVSARCMLSVTRFVCPFILLQRNK